MAGGQQFQLRVTGDQSLAGVQYLGDVRRGTRDGRDPDQGTAMQVLMSGLADRDVESTSQFGDDRPDGGPLLLQRMNVAEQDIQLQGTDVHGHHHGFEPGPSR